MTATTEIVPTTQSVGALFKNAKLQVPRFQRAYSWKNSQVDQLFEDVNSARTDGAAHYFMGAMVLQTADNEITIVDGQQRLATISILFAVLRDHPKATTALSDWIQGELLGRKDRHGAWHPSLRLSEADRDRFYRSISLPSTESDWEDPAKIKKKDCEFKSQYRIVSAYRKLRKKLNQLLEGVSASKQEQILDKFVDTLVDKIVFITISVPTDDMAYTVFETLNERGLGLSVSDLLKNYLLSNAGSHLDVVYRDWKKIESNVDPDDIPRFLRHRHMATKGTISSRQLYKATKNHVGTSAASIRSFVQGVKDDSGHYAALRDPDSGNWTKSDLRRSLSDLSRLRASQCLPLLLACTTEWKNKGGIDEKRLTQVTTAVEAFTVRYSVVGNLNPNDLEPFYSKLAIAVKKGKLSTVTDIQAKLAAMAPDNTEFEEAFRKMEPVNPSHASTRYLLQRLEANLWKKTGSPPDMYDPSKCHVEHLLPQTPTTAWEKVADDAKVEYDEVVNLIGNLMLIEWKINIKNGNKGFQEVKKKRFQKSVYETPKSLAKNHEKWDVDEIRKRQADMAKNAIRVWVL